MPMTPARLIAAAALIGSLPNAQALQIVFNDVGESQGHSAMSSEALAGFEQAASLWESLISNPVTVNINIACYNFGAGQSNTIGQAGSTFYNGSYAEISGAWAASATSALDATVIASLPTGNTYVRRINLTMDLTATPVLAESDFMWINGGNAKAMGLLPADSSDVDAEIEFNSDFAFDYNRTNGIASNQMDFVGVAAHEIGHALGFISIVDFIDGGGFSSADVASMPMDMLRYSIASYSMGVTDVSIDDQARYLVLGNLGVAMSTGVINGNGQQAAHFLDNVGLGMMDPTASYGELRTFSAFDLAVMDAIGWELTPAGTALAAPAVMQAIPEPSTYGLGLGGLALAVAAFRRRKA